MNPLVSPSGAITTPFSSDSLAQPWGEAYVAAGNGRTAALYVSDVGGSIYRIALNGDAQTSFTQIATGFCGSGVPGSVFAPAGLTYDASIDTLYIVDTSSNSVVAFANDDINITAGQTPNLAMEISPVLPGGFVGQPLQLDGGAAGGLFGIVAAVDAQRNQIVYFNDDNTNTVMMVTAPVPGG
jgi:hypothetical protein